MDIPFPLFYLHHDENGLSLCPEVGSVARVSEESLDGIETERFRVTRTDDYGPVATTGEGAPTNATSETTWDIWLNDDGQAVQSLRTVEADGETGTVRTVV